MLPHNVAEAGKHRLWPTLRKAPDRVLIWTDKLNGVGPRAIKFAEPQSGFDTGPRRAVERRGKKALAKGHAYRHKDGSRRYRQAEV